MKIVHLFWPSALAVLVWTMFAVSVRGEPLRKDVRLDQRDLDFLRAHQPEAHRKTVSDDYLRENVRLAREAREAAPWKTELADDLYREYVLPYTVIDEEVDRWRPVFCEKFWPLVKHCKTAGEAAAILHANVWKMLDVRYDTRRDKANQSPFHSMRIHMASCTGLAILEVCAFRACGIPARLVGCNWTPIPGNHSWVEFYDRGAWHFFGDANGDKPAPIDACWFTDYAALADDASPRTRIYATRWSPNDTGSRFWRTWARPDAPSEVPADDVTASYRRFRKAIPASRVAIVARGADGRRVSVPFRVIVSGSGKVVCEGRTYDESHDMNDHVVVEQPEKTTAYVQVRTASGVWQGRKEIHFTGTQSLCTLAEIPNS